MWMCWSKFGIKRPETPNDCSKQIYLMCSQFDDNEWILWHHSGNDSSKRLSLPLPSICLQWLQCALCTVYSVQHQNVDHWLPPFRLKEKINFFLSKSVFSVDSFAMHLRKTSMPDFIHNVSLARSVHLCTLHVARTMKSDLYSNQFELSKKHAS